MGLLLGFPSNGFESNIKGHHKMMLEYLKLNPVLMPLIQYLLFMSLWNLSILKYRKGLKDEKIEKYKINLFGISTDDPKMQNSTEAGDYHANYGKTFSVNLESLETVVQVKELQETRFFYGYNTTNSTYTKYQSKYT